MIAARWDLLVAIALAAAGCSAERPPFGMPCVEHVECTEQGGEGYLCVGERCVPARKRGDIGEDCARPWRLHQIGPNPLPLHGETALHGAATSYRATCAEGDDLVFSFTLPEPKPLRVRAEADVPLALSMRPIESDDCDIEIPDGCAEGGELLVARADAGEWALIVHGAGNPDTVVEVTVEELDCPLGFLPFDEGRCAGFRDVRPSNFRRADARLTAMADGRAILTGGVDANGSAVAAGEVFEPVSETWSYVAFVIRRSNHSPVVLGDSLVVVGGGEDPEILRRDMSGSELVEGLRFEDRDDVLSEEEARVVAVGTPSGALLLLFDRSQFLMQVQRPTINCVSSIDCAGFPGALCVMGTPSPGDPFPDGICLCSAGPCTDESVLVSRTEAEPDGDWPRDAATRQRPAVATTSGDGEVIVVHNGGTIHVLDVASGFWRVTRMAAPIDEVSLSPIGGGVLASGGLGNGAASAQVLLFDTMTRRPQQLAALRDPRRRHAQAQLLDGTFLLVGGTTTGDLPLDSAELVDLNGRELPRLPRLPKPLARAHAATLSDGRVLIVGTSSEGGLMDEALLFETVPAGSPPQRPDLSAFCGAIEPIRVMPRTRAEPPTYRETTVNELDRFRDPSCGTAYETVGPERLFSFELADAASLLADTDLDYAAFSLWRGGCEDHEALGCVNALGGQTLLEAPTLEAGPYVLVVEAHEYDDYSRLKGTAFDLHIWRDKPRGCPTGEEDPADDTAAGARRLGVVLDFGDPRFAPYLGATGTLCRGDTEQPADVDHLILEWWSRDSELSLDNVARDSATLAAAIIDEAASVAAGEPVFTFGAPEPLDAARERAPGIYLLQLLIGEDDPLLHRWSVVQYPETCVPDEADSVVAALDDGGDPGKRVVLSEGQQVQRCVTSELDLDVTVAQLPTGADAVLDVLDGSQLSVQLYALATPDAPLDQVLGVPLGYSGRVVVPAGTSPWVALAVRATGARGDSYRLLLTRSDATGACADAVPLQDSGAIDYDSDSLQARLGPEDYGDCTGYWAPGAELVGTLLLRDGDRVDATIEPTGQADVSIYLLNSCLVGSPSCVAGLDWGADGESETISFTHSGPETRYYLVGDSYYAAPYAAVLSWSVTRAGP